MIAFWIAAFLAMAAAAALIVVYARRPVAIVDDPAQAVYLRQIEEIDDLAARDLIGEDERRSAKAEAARRVLGEKAALPEGAATKAAQTIVVSVIGAMGVVALAAYLLVGRPDLPDQPYKQRFEQWMRQDPNSLTPQQMLKRLEAKVAENPNNPEGFILLARLQAGLNDEFSAERSLERAAMLDPNNALTWQNLGMLRMRLANDEMTPEARGAFEKAVGLAPQAVVSRYVLGQAEIGEGRRAAGLARWRSLLPDLPEEERADLQRQIAAVERGGSAGGGSGRRAAPPTDPAIRAMVDGLAARLKSQPDDPAGWARLVRSYAVLQDQAALAGALGAARNLFKDRPDDLAAIEAAANVPQ
jgi:cytochrome c-type biogenesis protein CcmH